MAPSFLFFDSFFGTGFVYQGGAGFYFYLTVWAYFILMLVAIVLCFLGFRGSASIVICGVGPAFASVGLCFFVLFVGELYGFIGREARSPQARQAA